MNPKQTTPVPNAFFDNWLVELKGSDLKILLVIIRQTLGWVDKQGKGGRKSRDWISGTQLEKKTGLSRRAISSGLASLVQKGLIRVTDAGGWTLQDASQRKGKFRLFYELMPLEDTSVDKLGITGLNVLKIASADAEIAKDISKKVIEPMQNLHITKQTRQN